MFELGIARKYLVPRRGQLTMSLIAMMSVAVITLVVWLLLLFLSVTDGIEKNWLHKLTSMSAPVRITPTQNYYSSYYYQVDAISSLSNFTPKTLGEKLISSVTDPYSPDSDMEIPRFWPDREKNSDGSPKDLAKELFYAVESSGTIAQEYEITGALLKLKLLRSDERGHLRQGSLTQATYLTSLSSKSERQRELLIAPRIEDLNHLTVSAEIDSDIISDYESTTKRSSNFQTTIKALLANTKIHSWRSIEEQMTLPKAFFPSAFSIKAVAVLKNDQPVSLIASEKSYNSPNLVSGKLKRMGDKWQFTTQSKTYNAASLPIKSEKRVTFKGTPKLSNKAISATITLQHLELSGDIPWQLIEMNEAEAITSFEKMPEIAPLWAYEVNGETHLPENGAIIPKSFFENGVKIGDKGYFSYGAATTTSVQEQRLPFTVCGFYDPGVMSIGPKSIITSPHVIRDINSTSGSELFDANMGNGVGVWLSDIKETQKVKQEIKRSLDEKGLSNYFSVTSFDEYDFAKDLLGQFQSDKYLFTLVGAIILLVACSNIISLLVILVNDKKKEIGILQSMGASKKSIGATFAICGGAIGLLSTLLGVAFAYLTLANIDSLVALLSKLQGQDAFNALFYGNSLPSKMSHEAVLFIAIATPIISILAGLIPAIKACRVNPAKALRSE